MGKFSQGGDTPRPVVQIRDKDVSFVQGEGGHLLQEGFMTCSGGARQSFLPCHFSNSFYLKYSMC